MPLSTTIPPYSISYHRNAILSSDALCITWSPDSMPAGPRYLDLV